MPVEPMPRPSWRDLLEQQDGVLARGQALRSGMTEDAWQWRLDAGDWRPLLPGVAVAHNGPVTAAQKAWAAVLYAGPGAALTGLAALRRDGFTLDHTVHDVAVPQGRRVRRQPSPSWRRRHEARLDEVPVVLTHQVAGLEGLVHPLRLPPRTRPTIGVLHAAAFAPSDRAAETVLAAAVQQRLVEPADVRAALEGQPRLPRSRLLLDVLLDVEQGAHARGELDLLELLRAAALPLPDRLQHLVRAGRRYYLDAWWERQRVAVEVDGAQHRLVGEWEADLLRTNDVVGRGRAEGVVLLRFTLGQLRHDAPRVAGQLRAVLL